MMDGPTTDWSFIYRNAWRWQDSGDRWSSDWTPLMVFVAQSNAEGPPRLFGLLLAIVSDGVCALSSRLLLRGMKGPHLGVSAHSLSLTGLAWRCGRAMNDLRWWLSRQADHFARYNA